MGTLGLGVLVDDMEVLLQLAALVAKVGARFVGSRVPRLLVGRACLSLFGPSPVRLMSSMASRCLVSWPLPAACGSVFWPLPAACGSALAVVPVLAPDLVRCRWRSLAPPALLAMALDDGAGCRAIL